MWMTPPDDIPQHRAGLPINGSIIGIEKSLYLYQKYSSAVISIELKFPLMQKVCLDLLRDNATEQIPELVSVWLDPQ